MQNDGVAAYTWNARSQLITRGATTFQYDSFGRRTLNPARKNLLYEGWNVAQELSGTTPVANRILGGIDEFFSRTDSGGASSPITDALGSVLALTNSSGGITTQYGFDPFGNTTTSGAASTSAFQYTGRENDGNGLYYYRARYYNPQFGRFISEDPIGFGGGTNFYAYAEDDPIDWLDPFGLDITIRWLAGQDGNPSGHIVVAVNDEPFVGFENVDGTDAKAALDFSVPGFVREPGGGPNRQIWDAVLVRTTPDQDKQMLGYIRRRRENPGNYKLTGRNCSMFANNVFQAAGIDIPVSVKPKNLMHDIHTRCANHALNCAP